MRALFIVTASFALLSGCYLFHGGSDAPGVDAGTDPPRRIDSGRVIPPSGAGFAFLRATDPAASPFDPNPHVLMHIDTSGAPALTIASLEEGELFSGLQANRGFAGARTSRDTTVLFGGASGPSTLPYSVPFSPMGTSGNVLSFFDDAIVRTDAGGGELERYPIGGGAGFVDPDHRYAFRQQIGGDAESVMLLDLGSGGVQTLTLPIEGGVSRVWIGADDAVLAIAGEGFGFSPPVHSLFRVGLTGDSAELIEIATDDVAVAAFDRCANRLLAIDAGGAVIAIDIATGARSMLSSPISLAPITQYMPFAALAGLTPDGRHLVWLGTMDGTARRLAVTDLVEGSSQTVDADGIPAPWGCCEVIETNAQLGNFADGFLSINVSSRRRLPICSCAPPEEIVANAYRLQLAGAILEERAHCGRTIPWMLDDGAMLTCFQDERFIRLEITDRDGRSTPLTDGPWDVGAIPMSLDVGCAAP